MKRQETLKKLNQNNNFHLSLKVIQITDEEYLKDLSNLLNSSIIITSIEECYEKLFFAYNNNIEYVLINEKIDFLLPLVISITKDCVDIIKPIIPVYYLLKDNKIIQKVKTMCHKKTTTFESFKTKEELLNHIITLIK